MSEKYSYQDVIRFWRKQKIRTEEDYRRVLDSFRILFSYHSGVIENDRITYADTREVFENGGVCSYTGDLKTLFEIQNLKDCYDFMVQQAAARSPVSDELIRRMHKLLTKSTYDEKRYVINGERPGQYKKHDYVTGRYETGTSFEYVSEEMTELVDELCYVQPTDPEDIITVAVYAHNVIEHIHPFADGNGRVGRTLANYLLLIHDLPPVIIFDEDRKLYYEALEVYDLEEDLNPMREIFRYEMVKTWEKTMQLRDGEKQKSRLSLDDYL